MGGNKPTLVAGGNATRIGGLEKPDQRGCSMGDLASTTQRNTVHAPVDNYCRPYSRWPGVSGKCNDDLHGRDCSMQAVRVHQTQHRQYVRGCRGSLHEGRKFHWAGNPHALEEFAEEVKQPLKVQSLFDHGQPSRIIALLRIVNRYVGNLPPLPEVYPVNPATAVRNDRRDCELVEMMRWSKPPPLRTGGSPVRGNVRLTLAPMPDGRAKACILRGERERSR
jgi:hypothetical protein